uniref:S1 motif domain-containing protein n=1 Tax=Kalanchoe fedtschenkoi TaxID=63787 RepID=A0A7N0TSZ8_KALFE
MSGASSVGSLAGFSFPSGITIAADASSSSSPCLLIPSKFASRHPRLVSSVSVSVAASPAHTDQSSTAVDHGDRSPELLRRDRRSADWKAARAYNDKGIIYEGRVDGFNGGGLLIRFYSLLGFLPYPLLSPSHSCKEPNKTIQEIAKGLVGSTMSLKVLFSTRPGFYVPRYL